MKSFCFIYLVCCSAVLFLNGCEERSEKHTTAHESPREENSSASEDEQDVFIVEEETVAEDAEQERIPENLDEALETLMNQLVEYERKYIIEAGEGYAGAVHLGGGMGMRNKWGLRHRSELAKFFIRKGIYHADDMSSIINTALSRKVRGKPIELDQLIKYYRDYWAAEGIFAPLDLKCPHCEKEMKTGYSGPIFQGSDKSFFYGRCPDQLKDADDYYIDDYYYHPSGGWKTKREYETFEAEQECSSS